MKISYDKDGDILLLSFVEGRVSKDVEIGPNTFAAYDREGKLIEIQVSDASQQDRPWMTLEAAAVYLEKSTRTLERWIKDGQLKAKKVGREYRIEVKDLEKKSKGA